MDTPTQTSYFSGIRKMSESEKARCVSIAAKQPPGFSLPTVRELHPTWGMISEYKRTGDWDVYYEQYNRIILGSIKDPDAVIDQLRGKIAICWEKPGENCHRHIYAEWFERHTGLIVLEYQFGR